jgi:beta-galactosidase/beta-glucuronidase
MQKIFFTALLLFAIITNIVAQNATDISGKWKFQIDRNDMGIREKWFAKTLQDEINLPGSMPEKLKGDDVTVHTKWTGSLYDSSYYYNPYMEKYRVEGNVKLPFFLTPDKHYVGVAWYQKEVSIPSNWKNKRILLFLERPHIETTLWINNKEVGTQNSLCVPHVYDITQWVSKGKCRVSIRIDNRIKEINVGPDSHSITDQTQGNWNGIVGRMELQATPVTHFDDIQIYPDLQNKKANVKIKLVTGFNQDNVQIRLSAKSFNTGKQHVVPSVSKDFIIKEGVLNARWIYPWREYANLG